MTFTLYAGTTCAGTGTPAGTITWTQRGCGSEQPDDGAGWWPAYQATYNGSATYNASTGPWSRWRRRSWIRRRRRIFMTPLMLILSAPIGSTVHDQATVAGTAAGGMPTVT